MLDHWETGLSRYISTSNTHSGKNTSRLSRHLSGLSARPASGLFQQLCQLPTTVLEKLLKLKIFCFLLLSPCLFFFSMSLSLLLILRLLDNTQKPKRSLRHHWFFCAASGVEKLTGKWLWPGSQVGSIETARTGISLFPFFHIKPFWSGCALIPVFLVESFKFRMLVSFVWGAQLRF